MTVRHSLLLPCLAGLLLAAAPAPPDDREGRLIAFPNENGIGQTFVSTGPFDADGPFFQSLGTNGRSCVTCHQPADGWSVTPRNLQQRFEMTRGTDPVFRPNDGAGCGNASVANLGARRSAYNLLLAKGLFRIELPVPEDAEFTVLNVVNPYGCADPQKLSVYRRPLPATNLRFLTAVMWDGRETLPGNTLEQNLMRQANGATVGHAQGAGLPEPVQKQIVEFEMSLTTAQIVAAGAGRLDDRGFRGGPLALFAQRFWLGINDPLGTGVFDAAAFKLFPPGAPGDRRDAIARGETAFNGKPIAIRGVAGLNDALGAEVVQGTCTTCHNTPNVGNHSVPLAINIGVSDVSRQTPDLPLFLLARRGTGETVQTSDPGRALITGKWEDIGKVKGPVLRGLSGRAPYFHNGSAATLMDVVDFYDSRFRIGFTEQEKADLVAFLASL